MCSSQTRAALSMLSFLSSLSRQELKFPRPAIGGYLCNGMDPMEVVQLVGYFNPLPTKVLKSRLPIEDSTLPCPATYIVLTEDKLIAPDAQRRIAERFEGAETLEMDSCHQVMAQRPKELADILLHYA